MGLKSTIATIKNYFSPDKKAMSTGNMSFSLMNGIPVYGNGNPESNVKTMITEYDIYSIWKKIAKTAAGVPINVYKVKDENALKAYEYASKQHNYTVQSFIKKEILKTKALEMVQESHPLQVLLDNPNGVYSKNEFREGVYGFRLATGNTYIYTPLLEFGPNAGKPAELHLMPSQFTAPVVAQTWPRSILGFKMTLGNVIDFPAEEVVHIKYFNPEFTVDGSELVGLSPLKAGGNLIARKEGETAYTVSSFQNHGISGVMANESLDESVSPEAFGKMKSDFYSESAGARNAKKILFSHGKWKYTKIGLSPVDMDVLKSEVHSFKKACNLYGISDVLFNNDAASTESNVKEMVKQMYLNAVLPEVRAFVDALNLKVTPLFNGKGEKFYVDCDISGISELQEDMKQLMEVFAGLPIMIPNLIMEAFNYGKSPDPLMDKVYIKAGYTQLEDLDAIPPLDIVTPNGN